ncbi:MAG: Fe-S protein assembly co-chaperone HscB [Betaproteobacteria bacterium]|nr:Fe-S protein assembly co-chaperone HscB [Betaproteobacteria bacterium]
MNATSQLLAASHFELFGLPEQFAIDEDDLNRRHMLLRTKMHPDRHIGLAAEQLAAEQLAARINEAYRTLADPMLRAAYVLSCRGRDPFCENDNSMPAEFLEEQMEMRERLEEAADEQLRQNLAADAQQACRKCLDELEDQLKEPEPDLEAAAHTVRRMKYLRNFAAECAQT